MIECTDILTLGNRFESYLLHLERYISRQRYNGHTFQSTRDVGRVMGISDETVRIVEN